MIDNLLIQAIVNYGLESYFFLRIGRTDLLWEFKKITSTGVDRAIALYVMLRDNKIDLTHENIKKALL